MTALQVQPTLAGLIVAVSGVQVGAQYKTAEVAKSEWQMVQQSPPWAVDAWGLGCLMQEAFSGRTLTRTEELRNTEAIPQAVLQARQLRSQCYLACIWGRCPSSCFLSSALNTYV